MNALLWSVAISVTIIASAIGLATARNRSVQLAQASTSADWWDTSPKQEFGTYDDIRVETLPPSEPDPFSLDPLNSWMLPDVTEEEAPLFDQTWDALVDSGVLTGEGAGIDWDLELATFRQEEMA